MAIVTGACPTTYKSALDNALFAQRSPGQWGWRVITEGNVAKTVPNGPGEGDLREWAETRLEKYFGSP